MVKIGIIGTGGMANYHAQELKKIPGCRIAAACDIDAARAKAFGETHGVRRLYTDHREMLAAGGLDAVAVVTVDAAHAPVSLAAIRAGLHVLCEKPLALNFADAKKMASAAKRAGVVNMVNFSYRASSALARAAEWVGGGRFGRVIHFEASYLQSWLVSKAWGDWRTSPGWLWRLSSAHGSKGVLGDIGVHIIDMATMVAGPVAGVHCRLKTFEKIKGKRLGDYRLDANDSAILQCELAGGGLGVIHASRWATGHQNSLRLRVFCERGAVAIDLDRSYEELEVCEGPDIEKGSWKRVACGKIPNPISRFVAAVKKGKTDQPDFARGAEVQKVLDACFASDASGKSVRV